jgi:signal transduction histidine kinase
VRSAAMLRLANRSRIGGTTGPGLACTGEDGLRLIPLAGEYGAAARSDTEPVPASQGAFMSGWLARLRGLSPTTVDAGLAVLALVAQAAPFLFDSDGRPWTVVEILPILLVALPVIWRRRAPVTCLIVAAVGITAYSVVGDSGPEQPVWYGALILMYTVAERAPRRLRLATLAASAAGITVVGGVFGSIVASVREAFLWGAAYALGRNAQLRRAHAAMLRERAGRLERERTLEVGRAVERARAEIARDMHDVLGHAVSLMVVQAEAGPVVVRSSPERAEAAFDAIAAAGRDAMVQLRRLLGLLDERGDPRLPDLVAGVGPHVSLVNSGASRPLAPDVEAAAYRIIQEALTNIVKHSDAGTASVALDWNDAELSITIVDDGSRAPKPSNLPGGGTGLIGIRERAAACGGSAWFGPAPGERGFQVSVRLPA